MIDIVDVIVYREVYYEHVKPLLRAGSCATVITQTIEPILKGYGWTLDKFKAFQIIDLCQRFGHKDLIKIRAGNTEIDKDSFSQVPELKCPLRTEQPV